MIIETRGDVVSLSGSLHKNQWLTIRAAVGMLLRDYPQGVIVDCSQLEEISDAGAKTFLDAMRDIEAAHTRIIVVNLPEKVLNVLKAVPGVRSQLPIADSIEAARASLQMHRRALQASPAAAATGGAAVILVPLMANVDLTYGADLAARLARVTRAELRLVYLLEVTRTLPLNAPLQEEEAAAQAALQNAMQFIRSYNVPAVEHVERVRDAVDGVLTAIRLHQASHVVVGASNDSIANSDLDRFDMLVETLLHRAPCEVIIGRRRMQEPEGKGK